MVIFSLHFAKKKLELLYKYYSLTISSSMELSSTVGAATASAATQLKMVMNFILFTMRI